MGGSAKQVRDKVAKETGYTGSDLDKGAQAVGQKGAEGAEYLKDKGRGIAAGAGNRPVRRRSSHQCAYGSPCGDARRLRVQRWRAQASRTGRLVCARRGKRHQSHRPEQLTVPAIHRGTLHVCGAARPRRAAWPSTRQ